MNSELILNISEDNFDKLTFESSIPVITFFSAKRCSVCKMMEPIVEKIAIDYDGKINVYSVDVDEYGSLAERFRLQGIPTILMFKDGEVKERTSGFQSREVLDKIIESILNI